MERLYVDESGSMTATYCNIHPYFIIAIVRVKDSTKLKRIFKRFISKNLSELIIADNIDNDHKMFNNGKFIELKGSRFTPALKREFVNYFCRNNYFEVFYILVDNKKVASKNNGKFYNNTARAFNYLMRLALEYYINHHLIGKDPLILQLDERNESPETKYFLQDYLNTELTTGNIFEHECKVEYFDSCNNHIIQIADVFANLMYSELKANSYTAELTHMKSNNYLKHIFKFPL